MPSILKENSKDLKIKEQVLLEDASGLTIEFLVTEDENFLTASGYTEKYFLSVTG
jgi:hypothetical protein